MRYPNGSLLRYELSNTLVWIIHKTRTKKKLCKRFIGDILKKNGEVAGGPRENYESEKMFDPCEREEGDRQKGK